jgi:glutathione S-transferase
MILIGQYDSSFVRRVGIALRLYDIPFEHRPWSIIGDADRLQAINPLIRVPTLVLDDGDVLVEANLILDYLDRLVAAERRLYPQAEPDRHKALQVTALAGGMADKAVSLFYEKVLHETPSRTWIDRCVSQILAVLKALEADRAARAGSYWFGGRIGHADIAVAASLRHASEAHLGLIDLKLYPALKAHAELCEALPVFQEISQAFIAPA